MKIQFSNLIKRLRRISFALNNKIEIKDVTADDSEVYLNGRLIGIINRIYQSIRFTPNKNYQGVNVPVQVDDVARDLLDEEDEYNTVDYWGITTTDDGVITMDRDTKENRNIFKKFISKIMEFIY